jgi:hypothetical protein
MVEYQISKSNISTFDDVNRNVLPSFENRKKVYEPHTIFQETYGKVVEVRTFSV